MPHSSSQLAENFRPPEFQHEPFQEEGLPLLPMNIVDAELLTKIRERKKKWIAAIGALSAFMVPGLLLAGAASFLSFNSLFGFRVLCAVMGGSLPPKAEPIFDKTLLPWRIAAAAIFLAMGTALSFICPPFILAAISVAVSLGGTLYWGFKLGLEKFAKLYPNPRLHHSDQAIDISNKKTNDTKALIKNLEIIDARLRQQAAATYARNNSLTILGKNGPLLGTPGELTHSELQFEARARIDFTKERSELKTLAGNFGSILGLLLSGGVSAVGYFFFSSALSFTAPILAGATIGAALGKHLGPQYSKIGAVLGGLVGAVLTCTLSFSPFFTLFSAAVATLGATQLGKKVFSSYEKKSQFTLFKDKSPASELTQTNNISPQNWVEQVDHNSDFSSKQR